MGELAQLGRRLLGVVERLGQQGGGILPLVLDGAAGELSFSVEDFAPQRLAVTAAGQEARPMGADETRNIDVTARFLYGAAGAGLQTQGEARLRMTAVAFFEASGEPAHQVGYSIR